MAPSENSSKKVLVTGVNGYMASNIAAQFLAHGFDVRGTARTVAKGANVKRILEEKYGKGRVEIVEVEDIIAEGAFDEAIKGVHAVSHTASILSFSSHPKTVIPAVEASVISILNSARREPSIKHFIYTSSSTAATRAIPNVRASITSQTWNDLDLAEAWVPEAQRGGGHGWIVYGASKAAGEKALWKWVEGKELGFSVNAVLPATCLGPVICREEVSSTGAMVREIYEGRLKNVIDVAPQYFVSVEDTARLHVAPVLFQEVQKQRLFAWAAPYNWNDILRILREARPKKTFESDAEGLGQDLTTVENGEALALLKKMGRDGWVGLEECVVGGLESLGL